MPGTVDAEIGVIIAKQDRFPKAPVGWTAQPRRFVSTFLTACKTGGIFLKTSDSWPVTPSLGNVEDVTGGPVMQQEIPATLENRVIPIRAKRTNSGDRRQVSEAECGLSARRGRDMPPLLLNKNGEPESIAFSGARLCRPCRGKHNGGTPVSVSQLICRNG